MKTLYFRDVPKQAHGAAMIESVFCTSDRSELHNHDFFELFYVKRGELLHTINATSAVLRRGDFHLIRDCDVHCFQKHSLEPASLMNISFSKDFFHHILRAICPEESGCGLSFQGTLNAAQMIVVEEMVSMLRKVDLVSEEKLHYKKSLLLSLLQTILLTQTVLDSQTPTEIPPWLRRSIDALENPDLLQEGIPGLVRVCGRSQEHITRLTRKYYHKTPSQIINRIRIDHAQKLLSSTALSVLDISMAVGYESVSYFNRLFMEQVGMSPRSYRNSLHNFV